MTLKSETKLMKIADEFADFDLFKPKAQHGPIFHTQELESMFILTVELKGYTRTNIKVEVDEDGSRITISGEKPFQDSLVIGGKLVKKDIETRGFQKPFKVPKGVIFHQVSAQFNEDVSELVIRMPKVTKGLIGGQIEELKTEEVLPKPTKLLKVYTKEEEILEEETQGVEHDNGRDELSTNGKEDGGETPKPPRRKFKICTPLIFGSAFVMSLVVLVFHLVESSKQENPQKKKKQD